MAAERDEQPDADDEGHERPPVAGVERCGGRHALDPIEPRPW